jgi:hypothetical protein
MKNDRRKEKVQMFAERMIIETDETGAIKDLPNLPPHSKVEAIYLVLEQNSSEVVVQRKPHLEIVGQMEITGDIMESSPVSDWGS